jgi:hypothetical protein
MNGMGGAYSTMVERRSAYRVLLGKPDGKRPLERPELRFSVNIKMDLQEGNGGRYWIDLVEDRDWWQRALVNAVMNIRVP